MSRRLIGAPEEPHDVGLATQVLECTERTPVASVDPRADRDQNPVVAAKFADSDEIPVAVAGADEGKAFGVEVDEFFAKFHHQPGIRLIDYIDDSDDERLRSWFNWCSPDAEPKAFIRLMLAMMRAGREIWDQPNVVLFLQGRWSQGPGPSPGSIEAISVLAQLIGKTITELYGETKPTGDGSDPPLKALKFEP